MEKKLQKEFIALKLCLIMESIFINFLHVSRFLRGRKSLFKASQTSNHYLVLGKPLYSRNSHFQLWVCWIRIQIMENKMWNFMKVKSKSGPVVWMNVAILELASVLGWTFEGNIQLWIKFLFFFFFNETHSRCSFHCSHRSWLWRSWAPPSI